MTHPYRVALFALALVLVTPQLAHAQAADWRPPTRQMPAMPQVNDLRGNWLSPRADWFRGVEGVSGVAPSSLRASGEPRSGSSVLELVRFSDGPVPVVVWSDRNGDGRADMIEIYRSGGVAVQLLDADYDGSSDALRYYKSDGSLLRQDHM
ncbi:MAG TPA: hypothetical protein VFI96_06870 [Longimicrobiaceae bacterium]|nr:hypothetical protein [Longimicrobiaceae bacterium]